MGGKVPCGVATWRHQPPLGGLKGLKGLKMLARSLDLRGGRVISRHRKPRTTHHASRTAAANRTTHTTLDTHDRLAPPTPRTRA
ncbi:MAG: hypothetical protein LBT53_01760 [Puniceicoccales bacterium]|nr:hypothetical protein [Puniceicoccales bacterium]